MSIQWKAWQRDRDRKRGGHVASAVRKHTVDRKWGGQAKKFQGPPQCSTSDSEASPGPCKTLPAGAVGGSPPCQSQREDGPFTEYQAFSRPRWDPCESSWHSLSWWKVFKGEVKGGIKKWLAINHRLLLFGSPDVTERKRICVFSIWSASLCSAGCPHPSSSCLSLPRTGISVVIFIRQSLHLGGKVWRKLPFLFLVDKVRNAVRSVGPAEPLKASYICSEKFHSKKSPLFIPPESYFRND